MEEKGNLICEHCQSEVVSVDDFLSLSICHLFPCLGCGVIYAVEAADCWDGQKTLFTYWLVDIDEMANAAIRKAEEKNA